jgi:hypothetical protein
LKPRLELAEPLDRNCKPLPTEDFHLVDKIDEQLAAHETGHVLVGLAVGARLKSIASRNGVPADSHFSSTISGVVVTTFTPEFEGLKLRLQHLVAVGGMAGEALATGKYFEEIARDDLTRLRNYGLTETQIDRLTKLSADIILMANSRLMEPIWNLVLNGIERNQSPLVRGEVVNQMFLRQGVKFTDFAALDKILPPRQS